MGEPKQKTIEERWEEEGEGLHVIDENEPDPFLAEEDLDLDDEEDDE